MTRLAAAAMAGMSVVLLSGCTIVLQAGPSQSPSPAVEAATATATPVANMEAALQNASSSVAYVLTTYCDESYSTGSAFVVGDDLLMTAAHVVTNGQLVAVKLPGGEALDAGVVGLDLHTDSALLRVDQPIGAAALPFAHQMPRQGSSVGVLGYPLGVTGLHVNQGIVSAAEVDLEMADGSVLVDVLTVDAPINPGNSGGPVIDAYGSVLGLVHRGEARTTVDGTTLEFAEGMKHIIPARYLSERLTDWGDNPTQSADPCTDEANQGDAGITPDLTVLSDHPDAGTLGFVLYAHGAGINRGQYESSWEMFTPAMKERMQSLDAWAEGLSTSYWLEINVLEVTRTGENAVASVLLRTEQAGSYGPDGMTCTDWPIDYTFQLVDGVWLMDRAVARSDPQACS